MQSLTLALLATLFVWAIQWFFVNAVLAVVPCSEEVASIAREYFYVRIWAAPATLMLFTFKGWFIGMQDTRSPMATDILVNAVNMAASYYMAVYVGQGVIGVAYGTIIAQYSGLFLAVAIMVLKYGIIHIGTREILAAMKYLFIRSLCFMVVYVGFSALMSQYGDVELAVGSIIMKLFMFFSFFVDGFAYAGEALVGKAFGEQSAISYQQSDIRKIIRLLFNWSIGVGLFFTAIYAVLGDESIAIMTSDSEVLTAAKPYMGWLIAMPLVSALAFMWDGVYVGATAGVQIRNAMIWAALAFATGYIVTFTWLGTQALYLAYFAHLIARVVYLTIERKKIYAED